MMSQTGDEFWMLESLSESGLADLVPVDPRLRFFTCCESGVADLDRSSPSEQSRLFNFTNTSCDGRTKEK